MLDIENALSAKYPQLTQKPTGKLMLKLLKKLMHEDDINRFIAKHQHLRGFAFLNKALSHFNFSYQVNAEELNRIPAVGKVIIIANHPIGSLDGMALLKLVRSVRPDVKIIANDLLNNITPLQSLFLGVDNLTEKPSQKAQYKAILQALENEEAVIIFPAGEVSRIRPNGVRDGKWQTGFLKIAKKSQAPILPIYIDASNSALFYSLSALYKPLGSLMLVQEMFNKQDQVIQFHIGKLIPWKSVEQLDLPPKKLANLFRKYLYRLNKPKKLAKFPFQTEETVAHPVDRKALKKELKNSELLGKTPDGKLIYLYEYQADSPVMQEIGRLREMTFRTVEEGTGEALDLDVYDSFYQHLILWDEEDLEIVGAYRFGPGERILEQKGITGFYTHTLFHFHNKIKEYLPESLELGRSFVQPRYWGKRSLDYLWLGIGAYINRHPHIRYLFGPVSLSDAYPDSAKQLIVAFYQKQFGSWQTLAQTLRPYDINLEIEKLAEENFNGDYKDAYKRLNALLALEGVKVPTLFKQYAELCDDKGCHFIDFSVDPHFNDCIDALIMVEMDKVTPKKRQRYLESFA